MSVIPPWYIEHMFDTMRRGTPQRVPLIPPEVDLLVGDNTAIRGFDAKKSGQSLDIFESAGRVPVVLELLSTPWLRRASDATVPPRVEVEVSVEWDGVNGRPSSFMRKGRRYEIDQVVQQWAIDSRWWDLERAVSRRCFRVIARGAVHELVYDRISGCWLLAGVGDPART